MIKMSTRKYINFLAFTLAEVLITLGIIGIVAEMTIPTLIQQVGERANRTSLKQVYSLLSNVQMELAMENGNSLVGLCSEYSGGTAMDRNNWYKDYFVQKLSTVKSCNANGSDAVMGNCWVANWRDLQNYSGWDFDAQSNSAGIILKNGVYLTIEWVTPTCDKQDMAGDIPYCAAISTDVNGVKKPNKMGYDIFRFFILKDRVLPMGMSNNLWINSNAYCSKSSRGDGCTAKILDNMDFVIPD